MYRQFMDTKPWRGSNESLSDVSIAITDDPGVLKQELDRVKYDVESQLAPAPKRPEYEIGHTGDDASDIIGVTQPPDAHGPSIFTPRLSES